MYNNWKRPVSISVLVLVAVSTMQLSSMITLNGNVIVDNVYAQKYSNNFEQAASLVNKCSGDGESSQICVNNNPQTQGEDNVVSTPIYSEINNPVEEAARQVLQTHRIFTESISVPSGQSRTLTAECPSDEVATGGGLFVGTVQGNPLFASRRGV